MMMRSSAGTGNETIDEIRNKFLLWRNVIGDSFIFVDEKQFD